MKWGEEGNTDIFQTILKCRSNRHSAYDFCVWQYLALGKYWVFQQLGLSMKLSAFNGKLDN